MAKGLGKKKLMKTEWWPLPHNLRHAWTYELDNNVIDSTIYPFLIQDEGLGAPSGKNTHPEHGSFAESSSPNCFVKSRIDNVLATIKLSLTSKALDDNIPSIQAAVMPFALAFKESYDATDEKSTETIKSILRMQYETTDRQAYPIWSGTKMATKFTNSGLLHADVPGLTTNQQIESVIHDINKFYDAIHYYTIANKMKSLVGGMKWLTLTQNRPVANIKLHIRSAAKRMNEYAFFGCFVYVPFVDTFFQTPVTADITAATNYVVCDVRSRFNEWNADFNFESV